MDLVPGFLELLQPMRMGMYAPTFQNLTILVAAWIFAGQRTVTGLLRAALVRRHHSSFHRVFANATWSLDRLGLAWFDPHESIASHPGGESRRRPGHPLMLRPLPCRPRTVA